MFTRYSVILSGVERSGTESKDPVELPGRRAVEKIRGIPRLRCAALGMTAIALCLLGAMAHGADQPNAAEAKLREGLRATMLQLRTTENERATLQAANADAEAKNKTLTEQVEALTKQAAADHDTNEQAITALNVKMTEQGEEIARLKESLDKWKTGYNQAAELARTKEAQRARLAGENIVLQRRVADQRTKNDEMFKIGTEILKRYERFGLGTALTAREPFVGVTRVKLENLVQDYGDKLSEQKIKSGP